jgi:hypothetical protein
VLVIYLDEIFGNPNRLGFRLTTCEGNLFSIVPFYLNLYCFLRRLFRCLIGVFVIVSMVVPIMYIVPRLLLVASASYLYFHLLRGANGLSGLCYSV